MVFNLHLLIDKVNGGKIMNKPILIRKDKHLKRPYISNTSNAHSTQQFLIHESEPIASDNSVALARFEIDALRLWESRYMLRKRVQRKAKQIHREASVY
jgi:hypothetical protein